MGIAHTLVVAALASVIAAGAFAQGAPRRGVIDGVVTDTNLVPLAGATASLVGSELKVTTGTNGRFRINGLAAGTYIVAVKGVGFSPILSQFAVTEGDTLRASYQLERFIPTLETAKITEKSEGPRLQEFNDRRKFGIGHFMNADEIDATRLTHASSLFLRIPTVQVWSTALGGAVAMNLRGNQANALRGGLQTACPYAVFVDGIPQKSGFDLNELPRPRDIGGIEVYSGPATIPLQYKRTTTDTMCGVILVWTR